MNKKIAIITGASRGIGKAVACALAKNDYHAVLIARDQTALDNVKKQIEEQGGEASIYALDIADHKKTEAVVDDIIKKFNQVDVLFNNAGVLTLGTVDVDIEEVDRLLQINLVATINLAKLVAAQMQQQKSGYIFNLSSMAGKRSFPTVGVYSASKFGLVGYNEALYLAMAPYDVKVTSICPSFVATDMVKESGFSLEDMIRVDDIVLTMFYLMSLSKNAGMRTIDVECVPYVVQQVNGMKSHDE